MRINCWITQDNRTSLSQMITAVNIKRAEMGLEEVSQAHVLNDIIQRAGEMTTINLCGVFLMKHSRSECDAVGIKR
ncbi:hypothetical protein [Huaxiibacter chinensis]|uniref:hypothetical protein n=1 Tax=Huaxiibacter chinensis TaxID=2899785 RepID=UPI003F95CDCE